MASHVPKALTRFEKIQLAVVIPRLLLTGITDFVRRTWRRRCITIKNVKRDLQRALTSQVTLLSLTQVRALIGGTSGQTIVHACSVRHLCHSAVPLDNTNGFPPATLHFIDSRPEDPGRVYLYFHGGGYSLPIRQIDFPLMMARNAKASLAVLEYSLAPENKYPVQLAQAVAALRFVLQNRQMSDIIIGGDSAGANLTLSLLAHLRKPHPRITPITSPVCGPCDKLLGVIASSPRTSDRIDHPSVTANAEKDYMSVQALKGIIEHWHPLPEVWAGAVYGGAAFWSDIRAERVLLLVGEDELYRDGVMEAGRIMNAGTSATSPVQMVICPDEVHVQMSVDYKLGIMDGHMLTTAVAWLESI